jgi:anti-sigma factor RsiW
VMTNRISKRDWERLSAYLDGQLSGRERSRLESRLQAEQPLQSAFEELRRTQLILRSLPKLRAPRNYTLTPEMVPERKERRRAYPIFGFASALATVLLVLVLVGDFFAPRQLAMAPGAENQALEVPAEQPRFQVLTPGIGGGEPPPEVTRKTVESEALQAVTPTVQATPAILAYPAEEAAQEAPMAGTEELEAVPSPEIRVENYPVPGAADQAEFLPTPEAEILPEPGIGDDLIFRILEIGLGLIAIGTGLAALLLRRGAGG